MATLLNFQIHLVFSKRSEASLIPSKGGSSFQGFMYKAQLSVKAEINYTKFEINHSPGLPNTIKLCTGQNQMYRRSDLEIPP